MKSFSILYCLLIAMLISSVTIAQPKVHDEAASDYISKITINLMDNPNDYTGSPYYNEEFSKAVILKQGKVVAYDQEVRYNVSKELFEIKDPLNKDSKILNTLLRESEIEIKTGDVSFEYISSEKSNIRGYFIPLFNGDKYSLYKKITKEYIPSQKAANSMSNDIAALYREKEILYLVDANGIFTEMPASKGAKIKVFDDQKMKVKAYVKENKLNVKKENDFIQLVTYVDSL